MELRHILSYITTLLFVSIRVQAEDHGRKPVGESVPLFVAERCDMVKSGHGNPTQRSWGISPRVSCGLDTQVSQKDTQRGDKGFY